MTERQRIAIIGTGCVGASIGLALRRSKEAPYLEILGYDRELGVDAEVKKRGGLDKTGFSLAQAVRQADMVILAVPLSEMERTLADVGKHARPGTIVTDTAKLKAPVIAWAKAALPPEVPFVGGDPLLVPVGADFTPLRGAACARADLFQNATYVVTAQAQDDPRAVQSVVNLVRLLGAKPHFMEPLEHDVARATAEALPDLLATALFSSLHEAPGWEETSRLAGHTFALATAVLDDDPLSRQMVAWAGRESLLHALSLVQQELDALKSLLAREDAASLQESFAAVQQDRRRWLNEARTRSYANSPANKKWGGLLRRTFHALLGGSVVEQDLEQS